MALAGAVLLLASSLPLNATDPALVEAAISRFKRVIGDRLRFHNEAAQKTEIAIAIQLLNRMLDLGRPKSVRIA